MKRGDRTPVEIGIISDTHGLLRPEAIAQLTGSSLILHAGDIGAPEVLRELEKLAPVVAVRGNNDRDAWANSIPERQVMRMRGVSIAMLHDVHEIECALAECGHDVVVAGHSHRAQIERHGATLFVNPGSAGPRRFRLPVSVARLRIDRDGAHAQIITLDV